MGDVGRFFEDNGYYLAKGVFGSSEVRGMSADFDRIVRQICDSGEEVNARWDGPEVERLGSSHSVVIHTHNVQQYSATWTRALFHQKFLDVAEQIIGPDIILHHSKLFQKPAELGAPFPMHQDWEYFPSRLNSMVAAVIHLTEATDEMGCLRVYPGSHKLGRTKGSDGWSETLLEKYPIEGATIVEAEPGDVLFFSYFLIHGSMPNRSDQIRKTVLVQMHSGQDEMEPSSHPYEGLVLRGWNYGMTRNSANRSK